MKTILKKGDKVFVAPDYKDKSIRNRILTVKEVVENKDEIFAEEYVSFEEIESIIYGSQLYRVEENHPMYYMALNQKIDMGHYDIKRVPGGWLYSYTNKIAFVPFNDEFLVR